MNYLDRLNKELRLEHDKVFDSNTGLLKNEVAEYLYECPACGNKTSKLYAIKDGFKHDECLRCGFIYVNPRLNKEATIAFYNSPVNEVYNETKFHDNNSSISLDNQLNLENYKKVITHVKSVENKTLLEIGPGGGAFLRKAHTDKFRVHAIELNKTLIDKLAPYCEKIYTSDILSLELEDNFYDVIYFRDVMEHIPNVNAFLTKIRSILKPGGILFIDTHNIDSLINKATREYHTVLFAFEHPVHWSPTTLKIAAERVGLSHVKTYFDDIDFSLANILHYRLNPSFTYIYPPNKGGINNLFLKCLLGLLKLPVIRRIDKEVSSRVALLMKKGAKMQLVFTKLV
jgi:2-polyprenyl-3-methyl-5-hydroxy-6-metoxy-1,4-benzoquinol methylase